MTATTFNVKYGSITVFWRPGLDGGGRDFGQDFIPLVRELTGPVGRLLEMCAGPGFIGFSLLAHGLCESLVLADVNPAAVALAQETVRHNGLEDRVQVYLSDGLSGIPDRERFDLVVANPPHFAISPNAEPSLITDDADWRFHRRFYRDIGRFMAPGGSLLIQENSEGSRPETFRAMVEESGLDLLRAMWFAGGVAGPTFYYLWVRAQIPDLQVHSATPPVLIPLSTIEPSATEVTSGGPHYLDLENQTGGLVAVRLIDDFNRDQLWAPLAAIAPGGHLELPPMMLRPGRYTLIDAGTGLPTARIAVRTHGAPADACEPTTP